MTLPCLSCQTVASLLSAPPQPGLSQGSGWGHVYSPRREGAAWPYLCRGTAEWPRCRRHTPRTAERAWTRSPGSESAGIRGTLFVFVIHISAQHNKKPPGLVMNMCLLSPLPGRESSSASFCLRHQLRTVPSTQQALN